MIRAKILGSGLKEGGRGRPKYHLKKSRGDLVYGGEKEETFRKRQKFRAALSDSNTT